MYSAFPMVTMITFNSSSLFFSSSSPRSNSSLVVAFSFLPYHRLIGLLTFRLNMYSAQAVLGTRLNTTQFIAGFFLVGCYCAQLQRHLLLHHNRDVCRSFVACGKQMSPREFVSCVDTLYQTVSAIERSLIERIRIQHITWIVHNQLSEE